VASTPHRFWRSEEFGSSARLSRSRLAHVGSGRLSSALVGRSFGQKFRTRAPRHLVACRLNAGSALHGAGGGAPTGEMHATAGNASPQPDG
jgi:hypothetical protein